MAVEKAARQRAESREAALVPAPPESAATKAQQRNLG